MLSRYRKAVTFDHLLIFWRYRPSGLPGLKLPVAFISRDLERFIAVFCCKLCYFFEWFFCEICCKENLASFDQPISEYM